MKLAFIGEQEPLLFRFRRRPQEKAKSQRHDKCPDTRGTCEKRPTWMTRSVTASAMKFTAATPSRMACLALSMVAVPLGIQARRKETSTGLAISILVGLGYFLFFMVADSFEKKPGNTALLLYLVAQCYMPRTRHHVIHQGPQKITQHDTPHQSATA